MAFPSIRSSASSQNNKNDATVDVLLPATVSSGDLLFVVLTIDGGNGTLGATGWTSVASYVDNPNPNIRTQIFTKDNGADGTEDGTTLTFTLAGGAREESAHYSFAIDGSTTDLDDLIAGNVNVQGYSDTTATTTPDPASHTISGGSAKDVLWIVAGGMDGATTVSSFPTNYGNTNSQDSGGGGGVGAYWCSRNLNALTENPGTLTISQALASGHFTIGITPVAGGTQTDKTLTHSGVGTAAAPVKEVGVNRSFSGIGTSVFARLATLARIFTYSGVGTSTLAKSLELTKAFSGVGTSVLSSTKVAMLVLAYSGSGNAVLATTSVLGKLLSYVGTGTGSVLKEIGKTLSNTGSGLAAIARSLTLSRTLTYAGTAASALIREVQKTLAYSGTGTSVLVAIKSKLLNLAYSAVGSVAQAKEIGKSFSLSGTGAQVLSRTSSFLRSISFSGTGTSAVAKGMDMAILIGAVGTAALGTVKAKLVSLTYSALGTASTAKTVLLTRVLSALGTTALQKQVGKFFSPSGVGTMVANATKTFFRTIVVGGVGTCVALAETGLQHLATTTGTATLTLRKRVGIFRAYVGSGVVAGTKVIEKSLGINVLGTPAEQGSLATSHNSAMTGTGTPVGTEQFQAGGPPGVILAKRIIRAILIRVNRWF